MRRFLLLALLVIGTSAARAQDITLTQLVGLSRLPADLSPAHNAEADLPDWAFQPDTRQAEEEKLTWAWWPTGVADGTPPAQLSLRPNRQTLDVVLYLTRLTAFNRLHRELDRQHLKPLPVTCLGPGCLGERYTTEHYTVAFYQGKPGDYPYMVVIQARADSPGTSSKPATHPTAAAPNP